MEKQEINGEKLVETEESLSDDLFEGRKRKLRSLRQYSKMSDQEFEEIWEKKLTGVTTNKEFESRVQRKIDSFSADYDLDDLKANDKLVLRALAQAYIQLEDLENYAYTKRYGGIKDDDIVMMEKMSNVMSILRRDISKMQDDLKITRRIRKGDKEESIILYLENLKRKAKEFYESKMSYIWCPNCKMLLGTIWTLYSEDGQNKIQLVCNRILPNGDKCGTKVRVTTKELHESRGVNISDIPEYFK